MYYCTNCNISDSSSHCLKIFTIFSRERKMKNGRKNVLYSKILMRLWRCPADLADTAKARPSKFFDPMNQNRQRRILRQPVISGSDSAGSGALFPLVQFCFRNFLPLSWFSFLRLPPQHRLAGAGNSAVLRTIGI